MEIPFTLVRPKTIRQNMDKPFLLHRNKFFKVIIKMKSKCLVAKEILMVFILANFLMA
jgi:hypothetical protein